MNFRKADKHLQQQQPPHPRSHTALPAGRRTRLPVPTGLVWGGWGLLQLEWQALTSGGAPRGRSRGNSRVPNVMGCLPHAGSRPLPQGLGLPSRGGAALSPGGWQRGWHPWLCLVGGPEATSASHWQCFSPGGTCWGRPPGDQLFSRLRGGWGVHWERPWSEEPGGFGSFVATAGTEQESRSGEGRAPLDRPGVSAGGWGKTCPAPALPHLGGWQSR